jgi:hypothetical protein
MRMLDSLIPAGSPMRDRDTGRAAGLWLDGCVERNRPHHCDLAGLLPPGPSGVKETMVACDANDHFMSEPETPNSRSENFLSN